MKTKNSSILDKLADFIYDDMDINETCSPESLARFDHGLQKQMERAKVSAKKSWLSRAPMERSNFTNQIKTRAAEVISRFKNKEELIQAIQNGLLGGSAKQQFQLQFRNRRVDELSEEDLRSIIDDQEILNLLNKKNGDSE